METIGIADLKKLVMERLEAPHNYIGRSLVLWNADYNEYGIAYRVITSCCETYNKEHPDDQVWITISDEDYNEADYSNSEAHHIKYVPELQVEKKRRGILFNTGAYFPLNQQEQAAWLSFVNNHKNPCGEVSHECAVIVCAQTYVTLTEQQFGSNCDIYSIQPTIDEWYNWAKSFCDNEIVDFVYVYIKKNGVINDFDYWLRIMFALTEVKEDNNCSLRQIPENEVELKVSGIVPGNAALVLDFCKSIYQ